MDLCPELLTRIGEHLLLSAIALSIGTLLGAGAGLWIWNKPRISGWVSGTASTLQTIPSLALFAILLPFLGIGFLPAVTALTLYAMLPVFRNTVTALRECPQELIDASSVCGMSSFQCLLYVQVPLGLPLLIAGIRTSAVWTVGSATLAAFIGAGGLGEFINRGLALNDWHLLLLGAIPSALLAIGVDLSLGALEKKMWRWKNGVAA